MPQLFPSFPLLPKVRLGQVFTCPDLDVFNQIKISFGCYGRKNTCYLKFQLSEITNEYPLTLKDLRTKIIDASKIEDGKSFEINFKDIHNAKRKKFHFSLEGLNSSANNCVCAWKHPEVLPNFYSSSNQENDKTGSLVFKADYIEEAEDCSKTVDIIICVYNQLKLVLDCIEAIKLNTQYPNYQIIVIDDKSSEVCKEELKKLEGINLFLLDKNVGYTKAANYGLKKSNADYKILLNSDTQVTSGWLQRIMKCGESSPDIGILGPLSNNATWQSIPHSHLNNIRFSGEDAFPLLSVKELSQLTRDLSESKYPRTSHIHGSCFVIKEKVIEKIGYFDEENFDRGYREEDDYCLRAKAAGFDLVYVDNAFYFHHGCKSFTRAEQKSLIADHSLYYEEKYPEDNLEIARLRDENPLDYIRKKIREYSNVKEIQARKLKVGYLLNLGRSRSGGIISILQIINFLNKSGFNFHLVCHESQAKNLAYFPEFNIIPKTYRNYMDLIPQNFDILVGTHNSTVEDSLAPIIQLENKILPAYFIQDYEPYFYEQDSEEYIAALRSYNALPHIWGIAKTNWICDTVKLKTGLSVHKVLPGLNLDIYHYQGCPKPNNYPVQVVAMVRPRTPRRNPEVTLKVLKQIKEKYKDDVLISLFGADKEELDAQGLLSEEYQFEYELLGILNSFELAILFNKADIFLDASTYQAFGRTALEAMACGCVSIVPEAGGAREYALNNFNSLIVNTEDEIEIERNLEKLIEDFNFRETLKKQGVETAKEFTIERAAYSHLRSFLQFYSLYRT